MKPEKTTFADKKAQQLQKKIEELKYFETCRKYMKDIKSTSSIDLNTPGPATIATKLEWLFAAYIQDPVKRHTKVRVLFQERFHRGDLRYLKTIYNFCRNADKIALQYTTKYFDENEQPENK